MDNGNNNIYPPKNRLIEKYETFIDNYTQLVNNVNTFRDFITKNAEQMEKQFNELKQIQKEEDDKVVRETFPHLFIEITPIEKDLK